MRGTVLAGGWGPMTPEQFAALLPTLGIWMTAGLATGWLFGLMSHQASGRKR